MYIALSKLCIMYILLMDVLSSCRTLLCVQTLQLVYFIASQGKVDIKDCLYTTVLFNTICNLAIV